MKDRILFFFVHVLSAILVTLALSNIAVAVPPKTPITVDLSVPYIPKLNEITGATIRVASTLAAPNTTVKLILEKGAYSTVAASWQVDLKANESIYLSTTISFQEAGNWAVRAAAHYIIDAANSWGDMDSLYFNIQATASIKSFIIPEIEIEEQVAPGDKEPEVTLPETGISSPNAVPLPEPPSLDPNRREFSALGVLVPESPGQLTVTGRWGYYDRDDTPTDAASFLVQLVRGDDLAHLAWCYTDSAGHYSCGPVTNPGSSGIRTAVRTYVKKSPYSDVLEVVPPYTHSGGCRII